MACNRIAATARKYKGRFQSLAGFFVACNINHILRMLRRVSSFNPWRVFSWLATSSSQRKSGARSCFNPWRVFSWLATLWLADDPAGARAVSIPGGFFRGLQRAGRLALLPLRDVSIPGGFFRGLQLPRAALDPVPSKLFQSLAGFFVACNFILPGNQEGVDMFQSLAGFFVACNGGAYGHVGSGHRVSIPGGFFRGLQPDSTPPKSIAITVSIPGGFFRGLQPRPRAERLHEAVSIPGGFFRGLQQ